MDAIIDAFELYADEPTPEKFLALRAVVAQSPDYKPGDDNRIEAEELLDRNELDAALRLLMNDMPNAFLTPRFHFLAAMASDNLGDAQKAHLESLVGSVLLRGILDSGDGSPERPYLVSRVTDEYDVLGQLGKNLKTQSLIQKEHGVFDLMECDDGTELWFDVSMIFTRQNQLHSGSMEMPAASETETEEAETVTQPAEDAPAPQKSPWWKFGRN